MIEEPKKILFYKNIYYIEKDIKYLIYSDCFALIFIVSYILVLLNINININIIGGLIKKYFFITLISNFNLLINLIFAYFLANKYFFSEDNFYIF